MNENDPLCDFFKSFSDIKQQATELSLFDIIQEYEHKCCDRLSVLNLPSCQQDLLRYERNSWRLIRGIIENKIKSMGMIIQFPLLFKNIIRIITLHRN